MPCFVTPEGILSGYASLFGRRDQSGDVVEAGAFRASLARVPAERLRFLWQHDRAAPIGVILDVREDALGLAVVARVTPGAARGRDALALLAAGAVDGLSIGFTTRLARRYQALSGRRLVAVDLHEISIVTFPMLDRARIAPVDLGPPRRRPAAT